MQPVLTTARRRRGKRPAIAIKVTHTHYTLLAHTRREYTHDLTRSSASDRTCQHSPETVHTRSTYTWAVYRQHPLPVYPFPAVVVVYIVLC